MKYQYDAVVTKIISSNFIEAEIDLGFKIKTTQKLKIADFGIDKEAISRLKEICPPGTPVVVETKQSGPGWIADILIDLPVCDGKGNWPIKNCNLAAVVYREGWSTIHGDSPRTQTNS